MDFVATLSHSKFTKGCVFFQDASQFRYVKRLLPDHRGKSVPCTEQTQPIDAANEVNYQAQDTEPLLNI